MASSSSRFLGNAFFLFCKRLRVSQSSLLAPVFCTDTRVSNGDTDPDAPNPSNISCSVFQGLSARTTMAPGA